MKQYQNSSRAKEDWSWWECVCVKHFIEQTWNNTNKVKRRKIVAAVAAATTIARCQHNRQINTKISSKQRPNQTHYHVRNDVMISQFDYRLWIFFSCFIVLQCKYPQTFPLWLDIKRFPSIYLYPSLRSVSQGSLDTTHLNIKYTHTPSWKWRTMCTYRRKHWYHFVLYRVHLFVVRVRMSLVFFLCFCVRIISPFHCRWIVKRAAQMC